MTEPLTITAAAPLIQSGVLSPSDLLEQCFKRVDVYEPSVKAWAYLDRERARRDAHRLTNEQKQGLVRGPLHGIPIGVKDIIDVFDMPTGCGSKLWANSHARRDATVIERLRQAGAVILGKTVTTSYAYLDPPPTRNPWNLNLTPGGSSSGSAAAVACGMCLAALGTQTGGSTIRPASYCGVASIKPTWSRVSTHGVLPLAPSFDCVGIMANGVRDLAFVLQAVAGTDPRDPTTSRRLVPDYLTEIRHGQELFQGKPLAFSFGRLGGLFHDRATPVMQKMMDQVWRQMERHSSDIGDIGLPVSFGRVHEMHRRLMAVEAAAVHGERLGRHPDDYPPRIAELVQDGLQVSGPDVNEAREHHHEFRSAVSLVAERVYALVGPATPGPATHASTTGDPSFNSPWSYSRQPVVSIPVGASEDGMPLAVQLVAGHWHENQLLAAAVWWESRLAMPHRLPPVPG